MAVVYEQGISLAEINKQKVISYIIIVQVRV